MSAPCPPGASSKETELGETLKRAAIKGVVRFIFVVFALRSLQDGLVSTSCLIPKDSNVGNTPFGSFRNSRFVQVISLRPLHALVMSYSCPRGHLFFFLSSILLFTGSLHL